MYHWRKMLFVSLTISALEQEELLQLSILSKMSHKRNEILRIPCTSFMFLNRCFFFQDRKGEVWRLVQVDVDLAYMYYS